MESSVSNQRLAVGWHYKVLMARRWVTRLRVILRKMLNYLKLTSFNLGRGHREWIRKARKYFQLHQVIDDLRLGTTEMFLKGKANTWFDGFMQATQMLIGICFLKVT